MRILSNDYLSSVPGSGINVKGGPARFAADFSTVAISQGHEWIGLLHNPESGEYQERAVAGGKRFFSINAPSVTIEGLRELREPLAPEAYLAEDINSVKDLFKELRGDVLFLNGFSAYAWLLFAAAREIGLPVVIQHAGIFSREVEEYADLFTRAGRELCFAMEKDAAEYAAANIFLNEFSKKAFERIVQTRTVSNPHIIPLPHPGWPFEDAAGPKKRKERVLGVVARWDRIKNHEAILALAETLRETNVPWRIRSVTSIPDTAVHTEFKSRYRNCIEIVPPMSHTALMDFYQSVDVIILPSHFDVSPTVVMEAASLGVPTLISPNVGWVSEYEHCGMEEWIADFSRPHDVVRRLEKHFIRTEWPETKRFAEYIKKCHDPAIVYRSYLTLLKGTSIAT
ncbi:TPA: hypothetical protein DIV48_03265 [Candidatus Kaiserbacteria bacterium]|nr:MAG: hypothetical protein UY93_C0003G0081 [Parcubacteria group bacterium GW2011_GWA1_56_13]KKW46898.1 MAG: hypothetical protein UY97_C0002G0009 [Parcubacteria group bacterium GW2011_GWB1_57_6]HCR52632.1 hypothetical protein [Candidatus Kaiserbacteria bacterium]